MPFEATEADLRGMEEGREVRIQRKEGGREGGREGRTYLFGVPLVEMPALDDRILCVYTSITGHLRLKFCSSFLPSLPRSLPPSSNLLQLAVERKHLRRLLQESPILLLHTLQVVQIFQFGSSSLDEGREGDTDQVEVFPHGLLFAESAGELPGVVPGRGREGGRAYLCSDDAALERDGLDGGGCFGVAVDSQASSLQHQVTPLPLGATEADLRGKEGGREEERKGFRGRREGGREGRTYLFGVPLVEMPALDDGILWLCVEWKAYEVVFLSFLPYLPSFPPSLPPSLPLPTCCNLL